MTKAKVGPILILGVLLSVAFFGVSWGEDGLPPVRDILFGDVDLLPAIPGGTFLVTVAHLAPSPEDAVVNRGPAKCDAIRFRIDTLKVNADDGSIEVEMGETLRLAAGEASRLVYPVISRQGNTLPTYDLDLLGFRVRSERSSPHCNVVASGLFFPDADTTSPTAFSLIPSVGPSPNRNGNQGR